MRDKIVLIDGHSILNRAFYGVPDLTNSEGLHTNAVYGFLNIMFKILDEEKPEYLTVTFDVHAPTFRHEMFADYKGTRKPMAEELRQQVPVIKDVLRAMHIEVIENAGLDKTIGQYFAALTNMRSVGVMGDERTYDYAVALRAVNTIDFMTAEAAEIPYEVLNKVMSRVINEVRGVNRIFYDLTSKPPGTIEFE